MLEWRKRARATQLNFAVSLGDRTWDRFNRKKHESELRMKISYAFVGPPQSEDGGGYTKEQEELVSELILKCETYCNEKDDVIIAFLFVCAYKDDSTQVTVPLIRVKKNDGKNPKLSYFIDHVGRVYQDWSDFLGHNIFRGWWICTPEDAEYLLSGQDVQVKFYDQTARENVLRVVDIVSQGSAIFTSASLCVGFVLSCFPPTALVGVPLMTASAVVGAPAAAYITGKSVGTLVDRGIHKMSLNPFESSEARDCWLITAASVFGLATMGAGEMFIFSAEAGELAGSGTRLFCTVLNVSSLTVHGLGVVNSIYEVAKKDKVTALDVLQVGTSIFFFTHSVVTLKTASIIIKDAQQTALVAKRNSLPTKSRDAFDDHTLLSHREMLESGKVRTMPGNKEFIRDLKKIDHLEDFFHHFQIVRGSQLGVDEELFINGKAFVQMTEQERSTLIENSNDLKNNRITEAQFNKSVASIKSKYRIHFKRKIERASQKINEALGLTGLSPFDTQRMDQVLSQSGKNYNPKCVEVAKTMANRMECGENVSEFIAATEYLIRRLAAQVSELQKQNPNPTRPPKVKAKNFYFEKVADAFLNDGQTQDNIVKEFQDLMKTCEVENEKNGKMQFKSTMATANHYDKHSDFPQIDPNNNLTPESYFAIAKEMCSGTVQNPLWVQDESSLMCMFHSQKYGAVAVRYDNLADGTSVIATLMSEDLKEIKSAPRYICRS
ncbi:uncharacterized protein LOC121700753 [Alosa sapidissima]|uniref:uncharacterized protein LOC121700753 n=1 Tax=Alosa sapidissima TaxID=34773 RepID=UPI001C09AA2D|nr:uncharacterized protein LOC121700753 [Alosa sapidissima]